MASFRHLQFDLLILVLYCAVVYFVINQALISLGEQFAVKVDQADLDKQIKDAGLKDKLILKLALKSSYELDGWREITISLNNKQVDTFVVDWDSSSLTDIHNNPRRTIRVSDDLKLVQFQRLSSVGPGSTLKEVITVEAALKQKDGGSGLEVTAPLVDIGKLATGSDQDKERFQDFMAYKPLKFTLSLSLSPQTFDLSAFTRSSERRPDADDKALNLAKQRLSFNIKLSLIKLPWTAYFPWNQKQ